MNTTDILARINDDRQLKRRIKSYGRKEIPTAPGEGERARPLKCSWSRDLAARAEREDALRTGEGEPLVTITMNRASAQELFDNLDASIAAWEYTEGETLTYLVEARNALGVALLSAKETQP